MLEWVSRWVWGVSTFLVIIIDDSPQLSVCVRISNIDGHQTSPRTTLWARTLPVLLGCRNGLSPTRRGSRTVPSEMISVRKIAHLTNLLSTPVNLLSRWSIWTTKIID